MPASPCTIWSRKSSANLPLFDNRRVATIEFPLADFHKHIHAFAFIPGYKQHKFEDQDPINLEAVEIMGDLHDALEAGGYTGHELERFLVRILFCLFAEDTGIFEREAFRLYLETAPQTDGSDLGLHLARLFDVLNTPPDKRQKNLDETLAAFPYVNGELFCRAPRLRRLQPRHAQRAAGLHALRLVAHLARHLRLAVSGRHGRRRSAGRSAATTPASATSSKSSARCSSTTCAPSSSASKSNKAELKRFHEKLGRLRFLDPACGCGNFLVITYRELRLLELEVLKGSMHDSSSRTWTSSAFRWWTWTRSTASRSANGPRASPKWRCG